MPKLPPVLATFLPRLERKEWEAVAITAYAAAAWLFDRAAKSHRWTGPWFAKSLVIYLLLPFALHAFFALERARRAYAAVVLATLGAAMLAVRLDHAVARPMAWVVAGGAIVVSVPLLRWCDPRELGVRLGEVKLWLPPVALGYAVALAGIVVLVRTPEFEKSYPYVPFYPGHAPAFVWREAIELVDMFDWEFFFRGFLLFTLAPRIGVLPAILVQTMLFACTHFNKPEIEAYGSIVTGLLLGQVCWRVRSMLPAFVVHQLVFLSVEVAAVLVKLRTHP